MADKKVISIRFHIDNKEDMELYNRLVLEAGSTASLAYVVKSRVRDSYNQQDEYKYSHDLYAGIITTVREEIQELSMKMIGTMISGSNRVNENVMQSISFEEDKLPEKSEELPIGALDFLE